jgi:hypothetical protein
MFVLDFDRRNDNCFQMLSLGLDAAEPADEPTDERLGILAGPKGKAAFDALTRLTHDRVLEGLVNNRFSDHVAGTSPNESVHAMFKRYLNNNGGNRGWSLLQILLAIVVFKHNCMLLPFHALICHWLRLPGLCFLVIICSNKQCHLSILLLCVKCTHIILQLLNWCDTSSIGVTPL